jgi:hypothetical protein
MASVPTCQFGKDDDGAAPHSVVDPGPQLVGSGIAPPGNDEHQLRFVGEWVTEHDAEQDRPRIDPTMCAPRRLMLVPN